MKEILRFLYGEIFTSPAIDQNLHELCIVHGHRFAGSAMARNAAHYIADQLESYGLKNAQLQEFPLVGWQRGAAELILKGLNTKSFFCQALPYAPEADCEAELFDIGYCTQDDVVKNAVNIKGKIVLVDDKNPIGAPSLHRLQKYLMVKDAGAAGFLFVQSSPGGLAPTGSLAFNQKGSLDQTIPSAGISFETAAELRIRMKLNPLRVRLRLHNTLTPGICYNVLAELPGSGPSAIVLCAHFDGHDIAQGAVDNASGAVAVMEIARVLQLLKLHTTSSLHVALFSGEEVGLVGSHSYVEQLGDRINDVRIVFNLDCFSGVGPLSMIIHAPEEVFTLIDSYATELQDCIALSSHILPFSDHFPFYLKQIHGAFCHIPSGEGRGWGHTIADTLDKVDSFSTKRGAVSMAALLIQALQQETWPSTRFDIETIKSTLEKKLVDRMLKYEGHWSEIRSDH